MRERNEPSIEQFRYHDAAQSVWHFIWDEFCDWYVELKKDSGDSGRMTMAIFEQTLCLCSIPLMPFLTEELWHRLGAQREGESISLPALSAVRRKARRSQRSAKSSSYRMSSRRAAIFAPTLVSIRSCLWKV